MGINARELCSKHPDDLRRSRDGRCVRCESERRLEYRARNLEKQLAYREAYKERELALARARHAVNPEPRRASVRKYRDIHPERVKEQTAKQYWKDPTAAIARATEWKKANPDKVSAQQAEWRAANPDKIRVQNRKQYAKADKRKRLESNRKWQNANRDKVRASVRKWGDKNPDCEANRKAAKLNATPAWANRFFMLEAYRLARLRTKMFGYQWHVDHIVPLKSDLVCGLHCEANMQVIPGAENSAKGNRHWPHMPEGA